MAKQVIEWSGMREFQSYLARLQMNALPAMGRAIYEEAQPIFNASQRLVPVSGQLARESGGRLGAAGGHLRASGHVKPPVMVGSEIVVVIAYGGPAAPYAIYVHEIPAPPATSPGGRSARHLPPTQWKFLEKPVTEALPQLGPRVARRVMWIFSL